MIKSKLLSNLMGICAIFSSAISLAGGMDVAQEPSTWKPLIGLSAGPTWASANKTQTFYLQPDVQKSYVANHNNETFVTAELFFAGQKRWHPRLLTQPVVGQLGFAVAWSGDADVSGDVWEDANPNFNNFNYAYKINHTYVALKGRLLGEFDYVLEPYISGSLGVGFNRAYNYSETPKIPEEVPAPGFEAHTKTAFSYTLGVGLQKAIMTHLQAAVGYEFSDWGQSQLARATGQTMNQGLSPKHLYAQQVQCSLFYLI
ncbi:MAG: porin family protein [Legionellaceae bacterium]|nr:porin family protein [Legionellaceae bacterium]